MADNPVETHYTTPDLVETIPLLVSGAPDAFMSEVARRFSPPDTGMPEASAQG